MSAVHELITEDDEQVGDAGDNELTHGRPREAVAAQLPVPVVPLIQLYQRQHQPSFHETGCWSSIGPQQAPAQVVVIVQMVNNPKDGSMGCTRSIEAPDQPNHEYLELEQLPSLVTVPEVARVLRKSPKAVYSMLARGQLPTPVRMGRRVYIRRRDLIRWLQGKRAASSERRGR